MKQRGNKFPLIYLDSYVLQKDMRIRMPKEITNNLNAKPGISYFEVYLDPVQKKIVLVLKDKMANSGENNELL